MSNQNDAAAGPKDWLTEEQTQIMIELAQRGITLHWREGRVVTRPKGIMPEELRRALQRHREAIERWVEFAETIGRELKADVISSDFWLTPRVKRSCPPQSPSEAQEALTF